MFLTCRIMSITARLNYSQTIGIIDYSVQRIYTKYKRGEER